MRKKISIIFIIISALIIISTIFISKTNTKFKDYETKKYLLLNTYYSLLIADSPAKWEQGLMYVKNKQDINGFDGMIFLFPEKSVKTFWNKNTITDLDLYWLNDDKVVGKSFLPSIEKSKDIITVTSPQQANKVVEIIK